MLLYQDNMAKFAGLTTLDEMDRMMAASILFDEALEQSIDGLSMNYRVNQFIVLFLQILKVSTNVNHLRDICLAAIEAEAIIESLKKNEQGRQISLLDG